MPEFKNGFAIAYPVLPTKDVRRLIAYFRDVLGFEVRHDSEEYGIVVRGPAEVHLGETSKFYDGRTPGQGSVYFWVEDADALRAAYAASGALDLSTVEDRPWMMRDFTCLDPDGNQLGFGHALAIPAA